MGPRELSPRIRAIGIRARGQYFFGTADGSRALAREAGLTGFRPIPIQTEYFDRTLALLQARGVSAVFVAMPVNDATRAAIRPALEHGFSTYLDDFAARHAGFTVAGALFPAWPNREFGDGFSHLNPTGAARFSTMFDLFLRARLRSSATPQDLPENLAENQPVSWR